MEPRGQFTFYRSFYDSLKNLPEEIAYPLFMAICAYALDGVEAELDAVPKALFSLIKPNLDSSRKKASNGKNGGVTPAGVKQPETSGGVTPTGVKQPASKTEANWKQTGSKPEANRKQTPSKPEANRKQTPSKPEANWKQTGSKLEANAKQTGSKKEKEKEIEIEIENEIEYECTPQSPPQGDFEAFWTAYPKKVGKQAAKKAFDKVKVPVETLLTAIEQQKRSAQWSKDNGQFIPNPATWLVQGRWEDELLPEGKYAAALCGENREDMSADVEYLKQIFRDLEAENGEKLQGEG